MPKAIFKRPLKLIDILPSKRIILILLFLSVAALRLIYCTKLPVNTGDILRHIYYGLYAGQQGLATAGQSLVELNPSLSETSWSQFSYNYPFVTLLFFMLVGNISPTIFFAKLALTLIEGFNSWFIFRYSRQHLLAFIYWANPISIWWVSHEGQFEPLQSLFVIGALCMLSKNNPWSFILLALGVQVKLTAVLLLPYFVFSLRRDSLYPYILSLGTFAAGFLPTGIAMLHYPAVSQILGTSDTMAYNPYYWNVFENAMFGWNPGWLIIINQTASYGMLVLLARRMIKQREITTYFAPLAFIVLCKASGLAQFWYFVLFLPFLLPIQDRRLRLLLFGLTPLLDIRSLLQILWGPFGFTVGGYYDAMTAFTRLIL